MKPPTLLLTATLAGVFALAPFTRAAVPAHPPLTDLVDDQTAFALVVTDAPGLVKGWDLSPFARTWNDAKVANFFGPLRKDLDIDRWDDEARSATGKSIRELLALAKGGAMVAGSASFLADAMSGKGPADPDLLIAVEFGDNAAVVEKLISDASAKNENLRVETTNWAGVLVHSSQPPAPKIGVRLDASGSPVAQINAGGRPGSILPGVFAMYQGIWLGSPRYERVCAAIDAMKRGGLPNALGRSEPYLRAQKRAGEAQLLGYFSFPAIYPALLSVAQKSLPPPGTADGPPFTAEGLLKGLGLDALNAACITLNLGTKETRMTYGLDWSEDRGLTKLLAFGPGAAARPDWAAEKWISVSSTKFDLRATYAALQEMLAAISPQLFAMAENEIKNAGTDLGIDLRRDLLGSLGPDIFTAVALPVDANPDQPPALDQLDQLLAISLENPEALTKAIDAIKHAVFGEGVDQVLTKRDYLGQTLYTFNPPTQPGAPAARGFTYAIANRTLLVGVGSAATVETALQGMKETRPAFWARPEVRTALGGLPDAASSIQVQDTRVIMAGMFGLLAGLPLPPGAGMVDASARPDLTLIARYWGLSTGYSLKDAKGFFGVSRLAYPPP